MSFVARVIAILQIAGGFYGVCSALLALLRQGASLAMLLTLLLSLFALVAGVLLIEGHAQGWRLSRWVQGLQVPLLATPWLSYAWHTGAALPCYLRLSDPLRTGWDWSIPSQGLRLVADGPSTATVGVNLLALLLWLLLWSRR